MPNFSRRSFMVGSSLAAGTLFSVQSRRAIAVPGQPASNVSLDIRSLIEAERRNIRASMAREKIPGVAVCLIYEGRPTWIEGLGATDWKHGRRVNDRTIFSVQSVSKNFTATAIMLAVQRGLLDLDEPITTYLPDFSIHSRFEPAPAGKITLRLLLSHRAGLTQEAPVGNNYDPEFTDFETHIRSISDTWLRFPVGERHRYSNLGVDLAGYILQTVTKTPFADYLKAALFDPLGMTDTTAATGDYVRRADRAVGHTMGYASVPLRIPLIPSGGIYTSARDMATWLHFHLNRGTVNGKVVLEERLWREMHSFSLGGDYSLGVARADLRYGTTSIRLLNHNGGGFGFGCVLDYFPEAQLGWAVLFNSENSAAYQFGAGLVDELLSHRFGPRSARLPAADLGLIEPQRGQLERLVGHYIGRALSGDMKLDNDRLGMQVGTALAQFRFTSPVDMFVVDPMGEAVLARYFPPTPNEPAHLESAIGDYSLDYNDGPNDLAGPNEPDWERFLGTYQIYQWHQPSEKVIIHRKNGYLYLNDVRLFVELEPGLFFTSDGEAVDFRHRQPTWRNIRLERAEPS